VLFAFVVFGSVSSVLCQEIGWEGCLLKLPILCPVGHKTFTQSISLTFGRHYCCGTVGKILGKPFGWYALLSSVQQQSVDGNWAISSNIYTVTLPATVTLGGASGCGRASPLCFQGHVVVAVGSRLAAAAML